MNQSADPGLSIHPGVIRLGAVVLALLLTGPVRGQGTGEIRLPGAVTERPTWLREAPFDVGRFFEMPPASQNAAPLYLEAFLAFSEEMDVCLPPSRRGNAAAAVANAKRIDKAFDMWFKDRDPAHLDRREIDALAAVMRGAAQQAGRRPAPASLRIRGGDHVRFPGPPPSGEPRRRPSVELARRPFARP